jgi:purine-binding chemotaxis protein CheW
MYRVPLRDITEQAHAGFLLFEVAGSLCAVPAGCVQEIVFLAELERPPGQPSVLEGFLNLRGRAVPVVRLDRLFDLPLTEASLHTPLIVLKIGGETFAVLVEHVLEIASVPAAALQPLSENDSFNGCAEARFAAGRRAVSVLATGRLLLEKEKRCVAELQAKAQVILDELRDSAE